MASDKGDTSGVSGGNAPGSRAGGDSPARGLPGTVTTTCDACGTVNEVDLEKGLAEAEVETGYFVRPCHHCGRELGALASRRYV